MEIIDWQLLSDAVLYYQNLGFEYIETPWTVRSEIAEITTCNADIHDNVDTNGETLVGSAEQGFIQLALDGKLDAVNYVSCSPCFRIADSQESASKIHQPYFMKVELFVLCATEEVAQYASRELVQRARSFMGFESEIVPIKGAGWDLEINGIEVGSYGARRYKELIWAYGTGLALPRYTQALNDIQKTTTIT